MNLGLALGGAALVGVGAGVGAWATQHAWPRTLGHLLRTEIRLGGAELRIRRLQAEVDQAQTDLAELRDDIPGVWESGFAAGQHTDEWTLVVAEVQRRQREHGGGRS